MLGEIKIEYLNFALTQKGRLAFGDYRTLASYNEHCKGLTQFAAYYGALLVMLLSTTYLFNRGQSQSGDLVSRRDSILYALFLMAAGGFAAMLFFMDFVGLGDDAWIKSRFIEIPYYFIIFSFLYGLHRFTQGRERTVWLTLVFIYTAAPVLGTQRLLQIADNWKVFIELVKMYPK